MSKIIEELEVKIQQNNHVLIYGAGVMGKRIYKLLTSKKFNEIKAFIVNNITNNPDSIEGIPVKCYKEFIDSYEKIIIALLDKKENNKVYMQLIKDGVSSERIILLNTLEKESLMKWRVFDSQEYWEKRYLEGGNSGAGSYHRLADFKAKVINEFVEKNDISKVIEWGCGDGNQLSLAKYPKYIGYDVSEYAISICQKKFAGDQTKVFKWCGDKNFVNDMKADLSISLDVLYHLVEDDVYHLYMNRLFQSSQKYVCIYSGDYEREYAPHIRCRKFTDYIEQNFKEWELVEYLPNEYPYDEKEPDDTSWADFYFYKRKYDN